MMAKKKNNNNRKKFDGCEVFLFRHIIFCFFIFLHYFHYGYGSSLGDAHSAPHNSMRIRYIYERVLCCVHAVGTVCHSLLPAISSVFVAPSWKMNYRRFCLGLSCTSRAYTHTHSRILWYGFPFVGVLMDFHLFYLIFDGFVSDCCRRRRRRHCYCCCWCVASMHDLIRKSFFCCWFAFSANVNIREPRN